MEEIAATYKVQNTVAFENVERHTQPQRQGLDELATFIELLGTAYDRGAPIRKSIGALPHHATGCVREHAHRCGNIDAAIRDNRGADQSTKLREHFACEV